SRRYPGSERFLRAAAKSKALMTFLAEDSQESCPGRYRLTHGASRVFLRGLHPMSGEFNVQLEYRRRRARVYKSLIFLVGLPFALTALGFYVAGPAAFLSAGMAATMLGIAASVLFVLRIWRCPACGKSLSANRGGGTLGGKCIACRAQLY